MKKIFGIAVEDILFFIESAFIALFITSMIFTYILHIAVVNGESMENTLMPDDRLVTTSLYSSINQGDIVIIYAGDSVTLNDDGSLNIGKGLRKTLVKRVIAVEGQTVDINFERGAVYVDGKMLDESYITSLTHMDEGAFTYKYPVEVPEGYVFVMGDNRQVSKDSRSDEIGFVSLESITGKVIMRVFPLDAFGFVE